MARAKKQAELREADRVGSEQVSLTLVKGQKAKIDRVAKVQRKTRSGVVQEAIDSWIFRPRVGPKNAKSRARRGARAV